MTSQNEQHTTRLGWRTRLGIGLLAATALTGVVAEMAPGSASSASASAVVVSVKLDAGIRVPPVRSCGSSWT